MKDYIEHICFNKIKKKTLSLKTRDRRRDNAVINVYKSVNIYLLKEFLPTI